MKNIRFMYDNLFDAATVTASSVDAEFPLTNLKHPWRTRAARTTGNASEWWKWDLGSARDIWATMFEYHNFPAAATVALYAHASDLGTSPSAWHSGASLKVPLVYGTDWNLKRLVKIWEAAQNYRWWFLWVQAAPQSSSYLELGRPFGGAYFQPFYNFFTGNSVTLVDASPKKYSMGGQLSVTKKGIYRGWRFTFGAVTAADMITFQAMYEDYAGQNTPYWICRDADQPLITSGYYENVKDWTFPDITGMDTIYSLDVEVKESQ